MKANDFLIHPASHETWIMHVPVVSTAHISPADDARLHQDDIGNAPVMADLNPGWLLSIDDLADFEEGYSDAFLHLIETFHNLGFHYLRLDPDGNDLDDLPTFEW
jgi:hypothetical protein